MSEAKPYSDEELAGYENYISKFSDQEAVTDERHMIIRFLATISERDKRIATLETELATATRLMTTTANARNLSDPEIAQLGYDITDFLVRNAGKDTTKTEGK
jgi:hypothetical protein